MAARIHELRARRDKLVEEANTALDAAVEAADGGEISAEAQKAQDEFDTKISAIDTEIDVEERKLSRARTFGSAGGSESNEPRVPGSGPQPDPDPIISQKNRAEEDPRKGFRSHRDFILSVMDNTGTRERGQLADERLRPLAQFDKEDRQANGELAFLLPEAFTPPGLVAAAGSDEQGAYQDRYGGFAVPSSFMPGPLSVPFEGDPTAGRTQPVPMATPSVDLVARTDKDHSSSVSGGLTVTRRPETVSATASRLEIEKVTLKASGLFGLAYATEEILTDSAISFAALIASGFRDQFPAHLLNEKIRGNGGAEFIGILNADAKVAVSKETGQDADTIVSDNIIKMAARSWGFGNAIWMAHHDTRPQLMKLVITTGTGGVLIYQPSDREGFPDMLLGRPIFYSEYMSTVGDAGDIALVNWTQYLEGLYQPLESAESVHVRFVNHERTFKFWLRNAGAPWWRSALTPAKGSNTLSPIVTLAARA